jgi:hypothetical protein
MRIDDLLPHIYEKVTGVPRTLAMRRLVESARTFCRDTTAWRENVTVTLVEGQSVYDLLMPVDPDEVVVSPAVATPVAELRRIHRVHLGDKRQVLGKKTETQMELEHNPGASSSVCVYTQPAASQIKFYGTPSAALEGTSVIVHASFQPVRDAEYLPDEFGERYYESLVDGALSLLYGMPSEKWSNITQSQRFANKYAAGADDARIEVEHEFSNRVVRIIGYGGI